jgi:hypothetical protein
MGDEELDFVILNNIAFDIDSDKLLQRLGLDAESDLAPEVQRLAEQAALIAKPKALFKEAFIEKRANGTVTIDGVTFSSQVLEANLSGVDRVFAYVATCGHELDSLKEQYDDLFMLYCLDRVKSMALQVARQYLRAFITERYGLGKLNSMNPGSGDASIWPIEQQKPLFTLIGEVDARIGVQLTETCLMEPNKTVSGIFYPAEVDFSTCELCHRQNCPNRRTPFNEQLWQEKMGNSQA